MKRKMIWSLSAMLAGTGFAAAQEIELASVKMANSTAARTGQIATSDCGGSLSGCSSCAPNYKLYGTAEYILWSMGTNFRQNGEAFLPPVRNPMPYGILTRSLVIAEDGSSTTRDVVNVFGTANFSPILFSGSSLDSFDRNGGRITIGANLNSEWAVEATYFQLEKREAGFTATAGSVIPGFTNGLKNLSQTGTPPTVVGTESEVIFDPSVNIAVEGFGSSKLFGVEANFKHHMVTIGQWRFSELYGARYLDLEQNQALTQDLSFNDPTYIGGIRFGDFQPGITNHTLLLGNYDARNQFYGVTVGLKGEADYGQFYTNLTGKFSGGGLVQHLRTQELVFTTETTALLDGTPPNTVPNTVYPNPTDRQENRTRLAFVLEGTWNAGFHVTENVSVFAGYNILVMTRVARPSSNTLPQQGDGTVTLSGPSVVGPAITQFSETRFYAQGLNVGLEFRY
ncbi:MAG: BBP7 family outer membrane beta-barrel protein [Gemmatales bacterium]